MCNLTYDISGIQTWIVVVKGKHANHETTITTALLKGTLKAWFSLDTKFSFSENYIYQRGAIPASF